MAFDPYSLNEILRALLLGGSQGGGSALGDSSSPEQIFPPPAPQFPMGNQANPNIRLMPSRTGGVYTNYDIPSGQLYGTQPGNQNMGAEMPLPYVLPGDTATEQYVNEQMAKAAAIQKAQADEAQRQADLEKVKAPKYIEQETEKMKLIAQEAKTQEEGRSRQIEEYIKSRGKLQESGAKPEDLTQFDNRILGIIGGGTNQGGVNLQSQIEGHAKQMMDAKGWQAAMDEAVATNDPEKRKIAVNFLNQNKPAPKTPATAPANASQMPTTGQQQIPADLQNAYQRALNQRLTPEQALQIAEREQTQKEFVGALKNPPSVSTPDYANIIAQFQRFNSTNPAKAMDFLRRVWPGLPEDIRNYLRDPLISPIAPYVRTL